MRMDSSVGRNPISPNLLTPKERRAELCRLLAIGLVRLHLRERDQVSGLNGESSLHFPLDQSGHATTATRRTT